MLIAVRHAGGGNQAVNTGLKMCIRDRVGGASPAGQAYLNICKRILGEDVPFLDLDKKGMLSKFKNMFKKN